MYRHGELELSAARMVSTLPHNAGMSAIHTRDIIMQIHKICNLFVWSGRRCLNALGIDGVKVWTHTYTPFLISRLRLPDAVE